MENNIRVTTSFPFANIWIFQTYVIIVEIYKVEKHTQQYANKRIY